VPNRNVTPSTTGSSQHNRPDNGTELLPDRLAEIRARLNHGGPQLGIDVRWLLDEVEAARASAERYRTQLVNMGRFDA
jgi:hypothetical protein